MRGLAIIHGIESFRRSSAVEQSAVNRSVTGSIPVVGAKKNPHKREGFLCFGSVASRVELACFNVSFHIFSLDIKDVARSGGSELLGIGCLGSVVLLSLL